jgi:hypothetical protein
MPSRGGRLIALFALLRRAGLWVAIGLTIGHTAPR